MSPCPSKTLGTHQSIVSSAPAEFVLIRAFLREGLVDEVTVDVVPILLGAGRPLFASGLPELPLRLLEAKSFPSGLVQLRYARA